MKDLQQLLVVFLSLLQNLQLESIKEKVSLGLLLSQLNTLVRQVLNQLKDEFRAEIIDHEDYKAGARIRLRGQGEDYLTLFVPEARPYVKNGVRPEELEQLLADQFHNVLRPRVVFRPDSEALEAFLKSANPSVRKDLLARIGFKTDTVRVSFTKD